MEKKYSYNYKEVKQKMAFKGKQPDYSGDGIAIWKAIDKNGKEFLKVKILGASNNINCFQVEPKKD